MTGSYLVSLLCPCRPLVRNSTSRYARLTHCRQLGGTRECQVNVTFLGFLCEIEGEFAEENP